MKFNIWEYEKKPLTDVLSFIVDNRGKSVPTAENGYKLIATNCIRNENLFPSYEKIRYLSEDVYQNWFRAHPLPGDIIFVCKGTPGRVCMVPDPIDFCIAQDMVALQVNKKIAYNKYLLVVLRSERIQKQIEQTSVGDVIPHFKKSFFDQILIPVPPMNIQKIVGDYYFAFSNKIECNNQINKNLEEQAQLLYKSWFVDFEPFGGKIPNDWKKGRLGDFIDIKRGGSPRPIQDYLSNSGFHWLKISDATGTCSPFINEIKEYIKEDGIKKTVFLKAGNLVLSNSATPGIPKIIDIDTCIHDGWLYFPLSIFSNEYLYLFFKYIRNQLVILGNGSVFTNLKTDILKNYQTFLPANSVLKAFDNIVNPIFNIILYNTRETKRLKEIRDALLPKLMSGELDVSDIDI